MERPYDVLHMGRSSIDLYANDIGAPFVEIQSFAAYVGGSPTNMCVAGQRLGLDNVLLTALGEDPVGDFVLNFLNKEGIVTDYIPRKQGYRTSAVLLGIEPPDRFPLVYYRERCADMQMTIDDVLAAPIAQSKALEFAGTNLYADPCRSATLFAAELARAKGTKVVLDIDFRPDQWHDPRAFGVAIRSALRLADVVVGTEDEIKAAVLSDPAQLQLTHSQVSDARVAGDINTAVETLLGYGVTGVVQKRGKAGARIHLHTGEVIDAPGYPVDVTNILGAGDAFGGGFLYGYVHGWDWYEAARLGNACGAIVVTRHGCANFMPTMAEVNAFVEPHGGLS
ncbi:MAG: 5-dehydro-2-deoxygluconokinase [Anaerolineales bacterium]